MLTVTQLASNAGRVWLNRRELRWRLVLLYGAAALPVGGAGCRRVSGRYGERPVA